MFMRALNRLYRNTRTLKVVFSLFAVLAVFFILDQLIYYSKLTDYHSQEVRSKLHPNEEAVDVTVPPAKSTPGIRRPSGKLIATESILGVQPEYWKFYQRADRKNFVCLKSNIAISWSKVNDDFCDCPDGTDEPSTSACNDGRFYCTKQSKGFPQFIPSSRVNDDICDCCDGSDEYEHFLDSKCKNRCLL